MGQPKEFEREKLIIGILYRDMELAGECEKRLETIFRRIDHRSSSYNFSEISGYYDTEMNGQVTKYFLSFEGLIDPARLVEIKLLTNMLEDEYSVNGGRQVNLDPGIIGHGRLILATTKKAPHRIPLNSGIYGEMTLFFARKKWQHLPWTYLDFKTDLVKQFLTEARNIYLQQRSTEFN